MSFNQGGINRQTFGNLGRMGLKANAGSKEDLTSEDPEIRSFNSMNNRFWSNNDFSKQRSATIHVRSTLKEGDRVIQEEDHKHQQSDGKRSGSRNRNQRFTQDSSESL